MTHPPAGPDTPPPPPGPKTPTLGGPTIPKPDVPPMPGDPVPGGPNKAYDRPVLQSNDAFEVYLAAHRTDPDPGGPTVPMPAPGGPSVPKGDVVWVKAAA